MDLVYRAFLAIGLLVAYSECTCNFPNVLSGTWHSSDFGMLEVNSTTIGPITIASYGALQFECYDIQGSKFISRSTESRRIGVSDGYFYLCMDLRYQSDNKYIYYLQSNKESSAGQIRVKVFAIADTPTASQICDTTVAEQSYHMLIRNGTVSSETAWCPNWISGNFNYTKGSACSSGSAMSNCDDTSLLVRNTTLCNLQLFFTKSPTVGCLYHTTVGSVEYLTVYDPDSSPTSTLYVCVVGEVTSDGFMAVTFTAECPDTATPSTATPSDVIHFTRLDSCPLPPTNPPQSTTTPPEPSTEPSKSSAAMETAAFLAVIVSLAAHAF